MLVKDWGWRRGLKGFLEAKYCYILKERKEKGVKISSHFRVQLNLLRLTKFELMLSLGL